MADFWKRSGLFDEDRSGFAFREVFTPSREGPLPPRPKPSGRGGSLYDKAVAQPTGSTWSASDASANAMTLSNGGLTVVGSGVTANWQSIRANSSKTSGKLYVEFLNTAITSGAGIYNQMFGFASSGFNAQNDLLGGNVYSVGLQPDITTPFTSVGFTGHYATAATTVGQNDVWALAIDFAAGSIWIAQNGVWQNGSNPAAGSLPIVSFVPATVGALFAGMSLLGANNGVWTLQSTAVSQKYAPPAGFSAWG